MTRRFVPALVAVLAMLVAAAASAQSCPYPQRLQYADGTIGCIGDLPISREIPVGLAGDVESTIPPSTAYSIAVAPRESGCPAVVAMVINKWPNANAGAYSNNKTSEDRSRSALEQCQRAVAAASGAASCACRTVIVDGRVASTRDELLSLLRR